jgi:hypothetical protein
MDYTEKINNILLCLEQVYIHGQTNVFCMANAIGILHETLDILRIEKEELENLHKTTISCKNGDINEQKKVDTSLSIIESN